MLSERIKKRILELYYNGFSYRDIVSQIKKESHKKIGIATISRLVKNEKTGELNVVREVKRTPKKRRLTISESVDQYNSHDKGIKTVVKHVLAPSGRKRGSRRMISGDPFEQEFNADDRDLAREAKKLGLQELIARRKQSIAKIKNGDKKENKILHTENVFLKFLFEVATVDPALAKAILDSYSLKDVIMFNLIYSGASGENLLAPVLSFIKRNEISVKDIVEIVKMMQSS